MKKLPIHQNLSTSFVDLSALVRYLRGLQFVGTVHLELSNYEANIIFTRTNGLQVEELDHRSGRTSKGSEAFKRVLERSREPLGRIHVFRSSESLAEAETPKVFVDKDISRQALLMASGRGDRLAGHMVASCQFVSPSFSNAEIEEFSLLINEILETIDDSLAKANLNFPVAFRNAANAIQNDFPFLDPAAGSIVFSNGRVKSTIIVEPGLFAAGIVEVIDRVFDRLRGKYTFSKALKYTQRRVSILIRNRSAEFAKFGLSPSIDTLLRA